MLAAGRIYRGAFEMGRQLQPGTLYKCESGLEMLGLVVLSFARADVWVPVKSGRGLGYQTESAWEVGGLVTRDFGHRPCLPPQGPRPLCLALWVWWCLLYSRLL